MGGGALPDHAPETPCARLGYGCLRSEVHVDDAESTAVSIGPLEVVHQGPDEVTPHIHSRERRLAQAAQVSFQKSDTFDVVHPAFWVHVIVERRPVLCDVYGQLRVVGMNPSQDVEQPIRPDRKPACGQRTLGRPPLGAVDAIPTGYDFSLVVIDPQEIDWRANDLEIVILTNRAQIRLAAVPGHHVLGIAGPAEGIQEPPILITVAACRGGDVLRLRRSRSNVRAVERDSDLTGDVSLTQRLDGEAVPEKKMMRRDHCRAPSGHHSRMPALQVSGEGRAPWLIDRDPEGDVVFEGG